MLIPYLAVAENSVPDEGLIKILGSEIEASAQRAAQEHMEKELRGELR
jgi:hypothetical protein